MIYDGPYKRKDAPDELQHKCWLRKSVDQITGKGGFRLDDFQHAPEYLDTLAEYQANTGGGDFIPVERRCQRLGKPYVTLLLTQFGNSTNEFTFYPKHRRTKSS